MKVLARWASRSISWIGFLVTAGIFFTALGIRLPSIPLIGLLGTATFPSFGVWQLLTATVLLSAWLWRWHKKGELSASLLAGVAGLSAITLGLSTIQFVRQMGNQGIPIEVWPSIKSNDNILASPIQVSAIAYGQSKFPMKLLVYQTRKGPAKSRPILVYIHGGGWVSGSPAQRSRDIAWFADQGMLAVSLDYTLSNENRHLWDRTEEEIGCGLAWVASHASKLGGNPGQIILFGDSAGGNLAINAAYRAAAGRLRSSCGGTVPSVRAVIAAYPVVDPANFWWNPDPILGGVARSMASQYTGGSPEKLPRRYATISSTSMINSAAPPTLLIIPEQDHLVPPEATFTFARKARLAGIRIRQIRVPMADHAFEAGPAGSLGNQVLRSSSRSFLEETVGFPHGPYKAH